LNKLFFYITILIFFLTGCSTPKASLPDERPEEYANTQTLTVTRVDEFTDSSETKTQATENKEDEKDVWLTYAEKYETEHHFSDLYIPAKCWLVGKENIVEIISVGGIDDVTIMEHKAVERVEHLNIGEFTTISVFDKTGQSISIILSQEETDKLLELIDKD